MHFFCKVSIYHALTHNPSELNSTSPFRFRKFIVSPHTVRRLPYMSIFNTKLPCISTIWHRPFTSTPFKNSSLNCSRNATFSNTDKGAEGIIEVRYSGTGTRSMLIESLRKLCCILYLCSYTKILRTFGFWTKVYSSDNNIEIKPINVKSENRACLQITNFWCEFLDSHSLEKMLFPGAPGVRISEFGFQFPTECEFVLYLIVLSSQNIWLWTMPIFCTY